MTNEQKSEIISLMKQHIEENDSVRVGWAVEQILKSKQQNHILDKLSAAITKTNEYIKEPANPNFKYDWNIRKNPTFKKSKWTERNPVLYDIIKIIAALVLGYLFRVITEPKDTQQESKINTEQSSNRKDSVHQP